MGPNGERARKFQETKEDTAIEAFGWSPDGKHYGYVFTDASGGTLLSRDSSGGSLVTLFKLSELKVNDMVWLHSGRVIYDLPEPGNGSVCNYWTMRFDLSTGKHLEEPRRLTNWPSFCVSSGSATNDDKHLAFAARSSFFTSYIADLEVGGTRIRNPKHVTWEDSNDIIFDWSGDSKTVIVAQQRGDSWGLYKQSLDSETPEPIVPLVPAGGPAYAVMSPDGKWVIALIWPVVGGVTPEHPSTLPIVRIPIAGGAPETILQVSRPVLVSCSRPPSKVCVIEESSDDHKTMVVSEFDPINGRGPELARFDLNREVDVFKENLVCDLSPDGTRLAITRSPESPIEIHSLRGQLTHIIASRPLGKLVGIRWSANGSGFFATRRAQGGTGTELLHIDLKGTTQSLYKCTGWGCFASPSPDGRHLAILDNKQSMNMWMMENF
jgi:Tol biopolymer transport system component